MLNRLSISDSVLGVACVTRIAPAVSWPSRRKLLLLGGSAVGRSRKRFSRALQPSLNDLMLYTASGPGREIKSVELSPKETFCGMRPISNVASGRCRHPWRVPGSSKKSDPRVASRSREFSLPDDRAEASGSMAIVYWPFFPLEYAGLCPRPRAPWMVKVPPFQSRMAAGDVAISMVSPDPVGPFGSTC